MANTAFQCSRQMPSRRLLWYREHWVRWHQGQPWDRGWSNHSFVRISSGINPSQGYKLPSSLPLQYDAMQCSYPFSKRVLYTWNYSQWSKMTHVYMCSKHFYHQDRT
jgi:hypothetical protein